MITMELLIISLVFFWLYFLWRRRKYYMLAYKMPGQLGYPLIGTSLTIQKRSEFFKFCKLYGEKFNHCGLTWLGPWPYLIVADPQIVEEIVTSPCCLNRSKFATDASEQMGYGLLALNGPEWSRHRKLLNPAFNNKVLMNFFLIFNEESEKLLVTLKNYCGHGNTDLLKIIKSSILAQTTRTMMDGDLITENTDILRDCYDYMIEFVMESTIYPWWKYDCVRKLLGKHIESKESKSKIDKFIQNLINQKLKSKQALQSVDSPPSNTKNFIKLALKLLDEGKFTIENVEGESHIIVVAAYETTTTAVLYILMLLAMFPDYQQKLFEEIVNFYPNRENFVINAEDLKQLIYLDMVINEAMRLMPPVPLVAKEVSSDMKLSNGVILPKGLQIGIDIFNMQRRCDIWGPEAHVFNPENFLPANLENKHAYTFLPFSKGPRICLGWRYAMLSMKVILTKLIRNYYFKTNLKFDELEFILDVALKLKTTPTFEIFQRDH